MRLGRSSQAYDRTSHLKFQSVWTTSEIPPFSPSQHGILNGQWSTMAAGLALFLCILHPFAFNSSHVPARQVPWFRGRGLICPASPCPEHAASYLRDHSSCTPGTLWHPLNITGEPRNLISDRSDRWLSGQKGPNLLRVRSFARSPRRELCGCVAGTCGTLGPEAHLPTRKKAKALVRRKAVLPESQLELGDQYS